MLITAPETVGLRPDGGNRLHPSASSASSLASRRSSGKRRSSRGGAPGGYETCTTDESDGDSAPDSDGEGEGVAPGDVAAEASASAGHEFVRTDVEWTLQRALRSPVFWSINIVGFVICGSTGAVSTHLALVAGDFGLDVAQMSRVRDPAPLTTDPAAALRSGDGDPSGGQDHHAGGK